MLGPSDPGPNLAMDLQHNKWSCVSATYVVKITGQYHPLNVDGELRFAPTLHSIGIPTGAVQCLMIVLLLSATA